MEKVESFDARRLHLPPLWRSCFGAISDTDEIDAHLSFSCGEPSCLVHGPSANDIFCDGIPRTWGRTRAVRVPIHAEPMRPNLKLECFQRRSRTTHIVTNIQGARKSVLGAAVAFRMFDSSCSGCIAVVVREQWGVVHASLDPGWGPDSRPGRGKLLWSLTISSPDRAPSRSTRNRETAVQSSACSRPSTRRENNTIMANILLLL